MTTAMTTEEHVEVWQQADGTWRWRWVGRDRPGGPELLPSNASESSLAAAVEAARTAYPDLPVLLPPASRSGAPVRRAAWRRWWPLALCLLLLLLRHRGVSPGAEPAGSGGR